MKEKFSTEFLNALTEVESEKLYQAKWGDDFDSKNTPNDWVSYIVKYLGQSVTLPWDAKQFRTQLIKTATLCLSAVEWCDKTNGNMAKRHYD
jgi:hypothetical protein